jgi:hypothetical protein
VYENGRYQTSGYGNHYTTSGFTSGEDLKSFVNQELGKLMHNHDMIGRAIVALHKASKGISENNYCEIRLEVPGRDLFAKRNSDILKKLLLKR